MSNSHKEYEECKGCKGCISSVKPQYIDKNDKLIVCPCQTCLIKGICHMSCQEYETYIAYFVMDMHKRGDI